MDGTMNALRAFARWSSWFGGALILIAALLIGVDVVLRKFFLMSIGGADELAGYALAIASAWGLGAALIERAHIRIDSLYGTFPQALRLTLDIVGIALFLAFFALVTWHGYGVFEQSIQSGSRGQSALQVPTAIPQLIWFAGLVVFLIIGITLLTVAVRLILKGEAGAASRIISTRSAQEEIEDELRVADIRIKARR
ncbi:TRAP transporter small permease [Acuticoccus sp. M5D2P5]|uniref:TRAP transporter small permease subunit n=1 Tax=Acuticoccus kalidii TaxID=2910977 RepID=UPI001F25917F|nr:TRAP transporter small permease [Acuticoccus kalidii]MCF3933253.1 TRAP transporter small permease [Acuticoccus kalidii]